MRILLSLLLITCLSIVQAQTLNVNAISEKAPNTLILKNCPAMNNYCKFEFKKIDTGKKDYDGNKIYHWRGVNIGKKNKTSKDTVVMIPDFPLWPTGYYEVEIAEWRQWVTFKEVRGFSGGGMTRMLFNDISSRYFTPDTKSFGFVSHVGDNPSKGHGSSVEVFSAKNNADYSAQYFFCTDEKQKYSISSDMGKFVIENTDAFKSEIMKHWSAGKRYAKELKENVSTKTYNDWISEWDGKQVYYYVKKNARINDSFVRFSGGWDRPKIKMDKEGNKIKTVTLNFPYSDGRFPDKEEYNFVMKPNSNGYFTGTTDQNEILVPFDDILLFVSAKTFKIMGVITSDPYNSLAHTIIYHDSYLPMVDKGFGGSHDIVAQKGTEIYEKWKMDQDFLTSYDKSTDDIWIDVYLKGYLEQIKF